MQSLETIQKEATVRVLEAEARTLEAKLASVTAKNVRQVPMVGGLDSNSVLGALEILSSYRAMDAGRNDKQPIQFNLNMGLASPRNSIIGNPYIDMFALVDYIRFMQEEGYKFTIQVTGMALQQAACLLQVADERIMTPHSQLMFTQDQAVVQANSADAGRQRKLFRRHEERARLLVCQRSGKVDIERFAQETNHDRHWWIDAKKAKELGLIDEIDVRLVPGEPWTVKPELLPVEGDSLDVRELKAKARKQLADAALYEMEAHVLEAAVRPLPVLFFGQVAPDTCTQAAIQLQRQARTPGAPLSLLIYSPGGHVVAGASLLDVIEKLKADGHQFETTAIGCAASMAGYLLQSGHQRVIGKHGLVMIHRISSLLHGGSDQMSDQEEMMLKLEQDVLPMLIKHSSISEDDYMKRTENSDWWLEAPEAAALKVVDRIR
jgi:ATP-dependent protease ClpP protease subunit